LITAFLRSERGQAAPAILGCALAIVFASSLLAGVGGATTGASRVQRAADLAALSGARTMYQAVPATVQSGLTANGVAHLKHQAASSARLAAARNGVDPDDVAVSFGAGILPMRIEVRVGGGIDPDRLPGGDRLRGANAERIRIVASATAEVAPPPGWWSGMPAYASGGGYAGPLVYRNGEGMRPDVAGAFDRMARAALRDGVVLYVVSGFRSDAEQAELFARHPDPRWVAPPGKSLHRCATELDLGPSASYGWLSRNARRFGFSQRYSWEAWHYGFTAGPAPCSASTGSGPEVSMASADLPEFVPARFRRPLIRSAARHGVSAALLAAQLMAESGFDPTAVSPAGAAGIAQFMPATAAEWGLTDRFDPVASIEAQARFMSSLLRQFRSVPLALAAYNAGPGAVASCGCVPAYPETRAYVARILALMDGSGALLAPGPEVRLVE